MIQDRINNYIQSYPQEMNNEMIKFAKIFFTDNKTVDHYIREVVGTVTEIGNIQEQLKKEVNCLATEWEERYLGTGNQFKEMADPTDNEENYNSEEIGKDDKEKENEYTGGRPSLFQEASWQRRQEEEARVEREAQDAAYKQMTTLSKEIQRFKSKPMHKHCIPKKNMIFMEQAQLLYNEMYDDCLSETLSLTEIKDLATTESCIPQVHG
jgi:hypothetical protein